MRSRIFTAALVPLAILALFAMPVAAEEEDPCRGLTDDPDAAEICEVRYYIQCDTAVGGKIQLAPPVTTPTPTFSDQAPAGSFTAGEGCGQADDQLFRNTVQDGLYSFDFKGFAEGNIDSMTIELHDFALYPERFDEEITIQLRLTIEGQSPFGSQTVQNVAGDDFQTPKIMDITLTPELSDTMLTTMYRFTVTGLDEVLGTARNALPDYEVIVTIDVPADGVSGWVWGADEVPSGLTINPLEPADTIVEAFVEA